jgi:hypothetical protein
MDIQRHPEQPHWQFWLAAAAFGLFFASPIVAVAMMAASRDGPAASQAHEAPGGRTTQDAPSHTNADIGDFAFGYLEFDWNPRAPGGVPGFDSWPPGSRRQ